MRVSLLLAVPRHVLPILFGSLLVACQSEPSHLYVLNAAATPTPDRSAVLASADAPGRGHGALPSPARLLGVTVVLPQYLDTLDIVERVGANELKPNPDAQWGESLSIDATRVVAENLGARLPAVEVIMLPSRMQRVPDYEVEIDLTRFESDLAGNALAKGRWTISDDAGHEIASARLWRQEQVSGRGYDATAAAMSRILAAVSADIATAAETLSARDSAARN
jgi:uncharacterized lipoprotein YmbA